MSEDTNTNEAQNVEVPAEPVDAPAEPVTEGKPVGPATIVEMETPMEQFPAHEENLTN